MEEETGATDNLPQENKKSLYVQGAIIVTAVVIVIIIGLTWFVRYQMRKNTAEIPLTPIVQNIPPSSHAMHPSMTPFLPSYASDCSKYTKMGYGPHNFYSCNLDATFYMPSNWQAFEEPRGYPVPCTPDTKSFLKNHANCVGTTGTYYIHFTPDLNTNDYSSLNLLGPGNALQVLNEGHSEPVEFATGNYAPPTGPIKFPTACGVNTAQFLWTKIPFTVNGEAYTLQVAKYVPLGYYVSIDCGLIIKTTGAKSVWSQFKIAYIYAQNKNELNLMINILQSAAF